MSDLDRSAIVIATYNRPKSLARLLASISLATINQVVDLIFSIDFSNEYSDINESIATDFQWPYGDVIINKHQSNLGLKKHILTIGEFAFCYEFIIVLEDDLVVSPCFYDFAMHAYDKYSREERIAGISLYSDDVEEVSLTQFSPIQDGYDNTFIAVPSSWGQVWWERPWRNFKAWLVALEMDASLLQILESKLPLNAQRWSDRSWKKLKYMYLMDSNLFYLYPRVSLSTNFGDAGSHMNGTVVYQVSILLGKMNYRFSSFEESLSIYDAFFELSPLVINKIHPSLKQYDYSVDLKGAKRNILDTYVLTRHDSKREIMSFHMDMYPIEQNILLNKPIHGGDIKLCHTKEVNSKVRLLRYLQLIIKNNKIVLTLGVLRRFLKGI
jgi:hypothetical protein